MVGRHATLTVIALILKRAQKNMEYSLKRPVLESFDALSLGANREFVQLYRDALSKV